MTRASDAPTCMLCGRKMRPERGTERMNEGLVQRWWFCPNCCHRQSVTEDCGQGGRIDERQSKCTYM